MCKTGPLGIFFKVAYFVSAAAALNVGLSAAGIFDFNSLAFIAMRPMVRVYLDYAIGAAGLLSLLGLSYHAYMCVCGSCECK